MVDSYREFEDLYAVNLHKLSNKQSGGWLVEMMRIKAYPTSL